MNGSGSVVQSGAFVAAKTGHRLRLVCEPASPQALCGTVVFVHAFAEEMNKSRRMAARMARLLAGDGWRVVQRDLAGCGDSSGDFGDATWEAWVDDVQAELLQASAAHPLWLWCERAGALLAPAALRAEPRLNLLLWQPVLSGARHLQQFLRLHAGARIAGSGGASTGPTPAQQLRAGHPVEVGGYLLNPALADGLERAAFDVEAGFAGRIVWFELSAGDVPELAPPSAHALAQLRERQIAVEATVLSGPPFWQTQEIEECEALLEHTLAALRGGGTALSATERAPLALRVDAGAASPAAPEGVVDELVAFQRAAVPLWGVVSRPPARVAPSHTAVLIVVGGPQYRVGSHRQFVTLARALAAAGFATLRYDYRGMGDSAGASCTFDACGPDLDAALGALHRACPGVKRVVVWGLCDGASAAMMFATSDVRVAGIVAANPWVRSAASLAATQLRFYYASRLMEREFWRKLARGGLDWRTSLASLRANLRGARQHRRGAGDDQSAPPGDASFQARMARGLASFTGRTLLILSGNDLTAKEFIGYADASPAWQGLLDTAQVSRIDIADADHTFSQRRWSGAVEAHTIAWLKSLDAAAAASAAQATTA